MAYRGQEKAQAAFARTFAADANGLMEYGEAFACEDLRLILVKDCY